LFEPLDFVARLAALVPKRRVNLTRFFGIFSPNSKNRSELTPRKTKQHKAVALTGQTQKAKRKAMTWAQRLKRVFGIDIETCQQCGGVVKVLASIEDPVVIAKILSHLTQKQIESISKKAVLRHNNLVMAYLTSRKGFMPKTPQSTNLN